MACLSGPAFFNLPNPTLILCNRLVVHAANDAAEFFFGHPQWTTAGDKCDHEVEDGDDISRGIPIQELGIQLEADYGGWDGVLERARKRQLVAEHIKHTKSESLTLLASLPPDEEVSIRIVPDRRDGRPQQGKEKADTESTPTFASIAVSAWTHHDHQYYTAIIYRRRRHERSPPHFCGEVDAPPPEAFMAEDESEQRS